MSGAEQKGTTANTWTKSNEKSLHCNYPLTGWLTRPRQVEINKSFHTNEIITIHVGQCGNQMGNAFWQNISREHKIGKTSGSFEGDITESIAGLLDRINVFYDQDKKTSSYKPRSIMVDLESGGMDRIKASTMSKFYKPDNYCFGEYGAGNNWAISH